MKIFVSQKYLAGLALALVATSASAGGWEVWTEKKGADRLTVVASFNGDGRIEDAQVDLSLAGSFEVLDVQTLKKGAVCVASAEASMLRALPPSGAGKALSKSASDTCMFTVRMVTKGWVASEVVSVKKTECASSYDGLIDCAAAVSELK